MPAGKAWWDATGRPTSAASTTSPSTWGSYPYPADEPVGGVATNFDLGRGQWLTGNVMMSRHLGSSHHVSIGTERRQHLQLGMLNYYDNIASVRVVGFDAEAEAKWPNGWQVLGSYTYSRARNTVTGERLTNSPVRVTQFRASAPLWARTVVALDMRALSSRETPHGTTVGAYAVPNVTVSRAIAGRGLSLALTFANLTNTRYADPVSTDFLQDAVVQDGRTARLRLSWSF